MIAKISKGGSFGGAVDYVLDKGKDAELLAGLGVRMKDRDSIVRSFRMQAALNPHLSKPVGHIVLAFSAQDAARLDNRRMVGIAAEYLSGMGIRNTQFIIARHRDREHPHLHILFNRVDNDGRTVSDRNDRYRSERLCKELTVRHGLYFASGKENVKEHRLREPDKTKSLKSRKRQGTTALFKCSFFAQICITPRISRRSGATFFWEYTLLQCL